MPLLDRLQAAILDLILEALPHLCIAHKVLLHSSMQSHPDPHVGLHVLVSSRNYASICRPHFSQTGQFWWSCRLWPGSIPAVWAAAYPAPWSGCQLHHMTFCWCVTALEDCWAMMLCLLCCAVLAVLCRAVLCHAVPCRAVLCCAVLRRAVPCCAVLCRAAPCCAVLLHFMS